MKREVVVISEVAGREIPTHERIAVPVGPPHFDRLRFSVGGCSLAPEQEWQFCARCGLLYDCILVPGVGRLCAGCIAARAVPAAA